MLRNKTNHTTIITLLGAIVLTVIGISQPVSGETPPPKGRDKKIKVEPGYAWKIIEPLGLREEAEMDTLLHNYYRNAVANGMSDAWVTTGNFGNEGKNMIFTGQKPISDFFLKDALEYWIPTAEKMKFYNTRMPMTLVSYNTGGGRETTQDRLLGTFSCNINAKAQIGARIDYLYSKGSYNYQADKHLNWGFSGSYIGDRYEFQGFFNHYHLLNKENGGITDPLYILDPAQLQGGDSKIDSKAIPTNLRDAHTRIVGQEFLMNHRYKVGFWETLPNDPDNPADTIVKRKYVPVTSFIWTFKYNYDRHQFHDDNATELGEFFGNTYLNPELTDTRTSAWSISNTVGISMLEGFNKWARFGLSAFMTHEIRKYTQTVDTVPRDVPEIVLTPWPEGIEKIEPDHKENRLWVGGQLTRQKGKILNYEATARFGLSGDCVGAVDLDGNVSTRFMLMGDTARIKAFGSFVNAPAPYFLNNYLSNHFIWKNDFGKQRTVKFGGELAWDKTGTRLNVTAANVQNALYFNELALPSQKSGSVQVFSASLAQNLKLGILHWDNRLTYQTSSDDKVIPLPKLAWYSNLYILCRIATLHLQLGIDCDYYTKFYAPSYQPATATFYNQTNEKFGNYPYMNFYANMKLSKARFYVMLSHANQGLIGGKNYFSTALYPLNPRRFLMGVSVDFAN